MVIWTIGMLLTLGYLSTIDTEYKTHKFDGVLGNLKLLFLCIFWPVAWGSLLAKMGKEED